MIHGVVPGGTVKRLVLTKGGTETIQVPTNRIFYLAWAVMQYIADATVVNRTSFIALTLPNATMIRLVSRSLIVAGETKQVTYNMHDNIVGTESAAANMGAGLLALYPTTVLYGSAYSAQAGDAWSVEGVYYEVPISSP